jgi:hypothetical protein
MNYEKRLIELNKMNDITEQNKPYKYLYSVCVCVLCIAISKDVNIVIKWSKPIYIVTSYIQTIDIVLCLFSNYIFVSFNTL